MSFEENNNIIENENCINNNICAANIRNENDEKKVDFVKNVISTADLPSNFNVLSHTNVNKIFYCDTNGETHRRDYVFFENNKFYCVYCLCFSALDKNSFVQGVQYVRGCRLPEKLQKHDTAPYHLAAVHIFCTKSMSLIGEVHQNVKRNALKAIFKIIIFLATHGTHIITKYKFNFISPSSRDSDFK